MDGSVAQLDGALIGLALPGVNADIFRLGVLRAHTAQIGAAQTAVALDFTDHGTQGVTVGGQQQTVPGIHASQIHQNAALVGQHRGVAQGGKGIHYPFCALGGKTGGGVHPQQCGSLLPGKICIFFLNHKKASIAPFGQAGGDFLSGVSYHRRPSLCNRVFPIPEKILHKKDAVDPRRWVSPGSAGMHPLAMTSLRPWQLTHTAGGHPVRRRVVVEIGRAQPAPWLSLWESWHG